ncbi:MAG: metallopeptidase TldD-related protein [Acidobacteriota bacterium]
MSGLPVELAEVARSASEELARHRLRSEIFARSGEIRGLRWQKGVWERRSTRELGAACRIAGRGQVGFAAASGSAARAGREAVRAALANLAPGPDPLPPRRVLGEAILPAPPRLPAPGEHEELARTLVRALAARPGGIELLELRLVVGAARAVLVTGEGFAGQFSSGGMVMELLLAPPAGPLRLLHRAACHPGDLDVDWLAAEACERVSRLASGGPPRRRLADTLLAPAVAAPLVAALALWLRGQGGRAPDLLTRRLRISPRWALHDDRVGPAGLAHQPFDGEGLPSRRLVLIAGGRLCERWASWQEAQEQGIPAGGAVRPSFREPPAGGPANLAVLATPARPAGSLLCELESGFALDLPAGEVPVDHDTGSFSLHAAALAIAGGQVAASHPLVELRGSFRRLLSGLAATGDDPASFSLACAVTTPSLLFRRLEIA